MKKKTKYLFLTLLLSIIFFLFSYLVSLFDNSNKSHSQIKNELDSKLLTKEKQAAIIINKIISDFSSDKNINYFRDESFQNSFTEEGISLFVFINDSLAYWNDNSVEIPEHVIKNNSPASANNASLLKLGNGWYECIFKDFKTYSAAALILIKYDYAYQNEYLSNSFNPCFGISPDIEISKEKGRYNIFSAGGAFLFSLQFNESAENYDQYSLLINLCNIAGIIFLVIAAYIISFYIFSSIHFAFRFLIFSSLIIILRLISFRFQIPHSFCISALFSPAFYAHSSLIPSLGDLLLYSIMLFIIISALFMQSNKSAVIFSKKSIQFILAFLSFLILIISFFGFIFLFRSLIFNSDIVLSFSNIFNLSVYSYIGLFIVSSLLFTWLLLCLLLVSNLLSSLNIRQFLLILSANIILFALIFLLFSLDFYYLLIAIFPFAFIAFLYAEMRYKPSAAKLFSFRSAIIFLLLFTSAVTLLLNRYNDIREKEVRKMLAIRLSQERDPTAEFLFRSVDEKIHRDETLKKLLNNISSEKAETDAKNYIQKNYFSGYWTKFNIQITICEPNDSLIVKPENISTTCTEFFSKMIQSSCSPTLTKNLFFRSAESVTNSYIAYLYFPREKNGLCTDINLFIDIDSKFVPRDLGYPRLLIDKKLNISSEYSNYAYSKYKNGELVYQFGKYFYRSILTDFSNPNKEFFFIYKNRYNHLVYNPDKYTTFVLSRENYSLIQKLSPFSYLIIFFSLSFLFIYSILISISKFNSQYYYQKHENRNMRFFHNLSLQSRIQYSIIFIIIVSFLCIGSLSVWYINRTNNTSNRTNLSEKTHSILVEIENKLSRYENISPQMYDYISGLLVNFSNVFFTDINFFSKNGRLIASSRPKIYDEGLLSLNMNPYACSRMIYDNKTLIINHENIGSLSFYSSYMPVRNIHNSVIAYLNLPYFAKQNENDNRISTFLTTFINTYIILVALSIIVVLLISNYITLPLKLIRDKISRVGLGRLNEKILWKHNDELGMLVHEYNSMIDKLAESADLLAKSERESAWREMAKQVAHEIKNPLTPMKLNIQHLLKISSNEHTTYNEQLNKVCKSLIEQIDILSDIASEFSDFAKMPSSKNQKVNLIQLINNSIELFRNYKDIHINFNEQLTTNIGQRFLVFADPNQLLRVFGNLIRNSIQAIEGKPDGRIDISVSSSDKFCLITISDNGSGIPLQDIHKIFSPNFTTKSGGSGLGLSISKSIIEAAGGSISFKSNPGSGTSFFISLPVFIES